MDRIIGHRRPASCGLENTDGFSPAPVRDRPEKGAGVILHFIYDALKLIRKSKGYVSRAVKHLVLAVDKNSMKIRLLFTLFAAVFI